MLGTNGHRNEPWNEPSNGPRNGPWKTEHRTERPLAWNGPIDRLDAQSNRSPGSGRGGPPQLHRVLRLLFGTDETFFVYNFTVSRTETNRIDATATLLVHGRPQAGKVAAGGMRYYVVRPDSDTAKMTVTLTKAVGDGDLYMARRNDTTTIDPLDDSTYRYVRSCANCHSARTIGIRRHVWCSCIDAVHVFRHSTPQSTGERSSAGRPRG